MRKQHTSKRSTSHRLRIRGKWWTVRFERPPIRKSVDGGCDYQRRVIYVDPRAERQRATLIHEIQHAAQPDLNEDAVVEIEIAIETGIKMMYRAKGL